MMESRPKRQSKKSAKLLTYEMESIASSKKTSKKSGEKSNIGVVAPGEPTVPKLTIKLGKNDDGSTSKLIQANATDKKPAGTPGRKRKKSGGITDPVSTTGEKPSTAKKKRKTKKESNFPTDVEIEADEDGNIMSVADSTGNEDLSEMVDQKSKRNQSSASKRQRKLPAKFADDEFDVESDMGTNKAAKFFEKKKAEQKAATALAKQEASKSGKTKRNRMPTAYTMWCNSYRTKLQAQCPGMSFAAINKKLGEVWWSIPLKEKNQWNRKAKRLATHGTPKTADSLKYLGSKAIASLQRNNCLPERSSSSKASASAETTVRVTNLNPVYKVTQTEPVDVAAHLSVMADALSDLGTELVDKKPVEVEGSLSLLLDSLLAGMSSLMCLTQQVPELDEGIDPLTHKQRMANISHFLPNDP